MCGDKGVVGGVGSCVGMTKGQIFTGLPRLCLAMTRVDEGARIGVWVCRV